MKNNLRKDLSLSLVRFFKGSSLGILTAGFLVSGLFVSVSQVFAADATTFDLNGSFANGITLTGVVTGNMFNSGKFDIESGTITITGGTTTGTGTLEPDLNGPGAIYTYQNPPNSGGANYTIDNILTPGSNPVLDKNGFLATIDGIPVSIWGDGSNNYELFAGNWLEDVHGTLTATALSSNTPVDQVVDITTGIGYQTIQAAVSNAGTGDTIDVAAGTYSEAISIKKSLTIVGAGATSTIIQSPASLPAEGAIVNVDGSGVKADISALTIEGPGPSGCGSLTSGIFVSGGANASIHDMTVKDIRDNPLSGCQNGRAILVGWGHGGTAPANTTGSATVTNVTISDYQKAGIEVSGSGSSATITNNVITGVGATSTIAQNGIEVTYDASGNISGNTVTGNSYIPTSNTAAGILLYEPAASTTVGTNTVSGNQFGLWTDDQASFPAVSISGISNNIRNAVADTTDWSKPPVSSVVNASFTGISNSDGSDIVSGGVMGYNAFTTIQPAINVLTNGGTVSVAAGTYSGDLMIPTSSITLQGTGSVVLNLDSGYGINLDNPPYVPTNFTMSGFTVNASNGTTYAFKAYKADNLTLTNDTFNGGTGNTGGGIDINTTNNVTFNNVTSTGFYKNGFADTVAYESTDTAGNGITFNNVTSTNNGWAGIAFSTIGNAGGVGSINGVHFTGTSTISGNSGEGVFIEGDSDANFGAHRTPQYTVTSNGTTLDLTHVAFGGNKLPYDIVNYQTAPVSAVGATFGGLTGNAMTSAQRTTEDGKIYDQLDLPALGLVSYYVLDTIPPVVTVTPVAGDSPLNGTTTFNITVTDNNPLDPTMNAKVWVYLYNNGGTQKQQGANVNLSSGTGTFTVDTTKLDNGISTLDVGKVSDAAGNLSGSGDNYFGGYDIENVTSSPSSVYVHIAKYIDGIPATTANASSTSFPMVSTWTAANLNSGIQSSGSYALNPGDSYEAVTSPMNSGANYVTNEVTTGPTVGASCSAGDPFALVGYSTGASLAIAASSTISTTTPNFTDLTGDEYVIVWNNNCLSSPTLFSPTSGTVTSTASLTSVSWNSVTDPAGNITYVYQSANSSSTNFDGSFTTPAYTSGSLTTTTISTLSTPAGIYYWHVKAIDTDGNMSPWSDMWTFTIDNTPPAPIYITTNSVTNVTSTSATVNGTNGSSLADNTSFWWGTTSAGPLIASADPAGVNNPATDELPSGWHDGVFSGSQVTGASFSYPLTGLTPSTTYYYAAWSEIDGVWYPGAVMSFTTAPAVYITTEAATDITSADAMLDGTNGVINADGTSFWVSTSTFSTSNSTVPAGVYNTPSVGPVAAGAAFSVPLSSVANLPAVMPGTTYYYAAWSSVGGVWYPGAVMSFTTPSLDSDATLGALSVSSGVLNPVFSPGVTSYTDSLPYYMTTLPTVAATTTVANATDTIANATSNTGTATVAVTAQNGTMAKQYTVNFSVAPTSTSLLKFAVVVVGGSATSSDFTLNVNASGASTSTFPGNPLGTLVAIDGGAHYYVNVTSSFQDYTQGTTGNCNGNSTPGYETDCTFTETFNTATPTIESSNVVGVGSGYNNLYTATTNNGSQVLGASATGGQVLGASTTNPVALLQELQNLEQQLIALEFKANSCSLTFNTNLSKGMTSSAVKNLQTVLNYAPLTQVATTGPGSPNNETTYFDNATKNAVIAFQNIFADQILTPNGMTSGNGYVGASTRSVLKGLCGQ
jgi:hypothetical protein